ncbi:MAG: hypothetical protein C4527_19280 [Candidatus Omnitrophota bacterium]|jgi:hypothetical protein|nr:MAG: hypothetical protein C4527_19280 [Candidatus Omnitrophota bacterium]
MNKTHPLLDGIVFFILLSGVWYASQFWPWARIMIALWLILFFVSRMKENDVLLKIHTLICFIACSASLWSFADQLIPNLPFHFIIGTWLGLAGFVCFNSFTGDQKEFIPHPTPASLSATIWPSATLTSCLLLATVGGWMMIHRFLNGLFDKPFYWEWWTSPTWAVISIMSFYPATLPRFVSRTERKLIKYLMPILMLSVASVHAIRFYTLNSTDDPGKGSPVSEQAFRFGYQNLGIQAAIRETLDIQTKKGWADAIHYLRRQWQYADKVMFAKAWRSHPDAGKDLFFFATCFGCTLMLQAEEEAVDFVVIPKKQAYVILTSRGRLLRMDTNGVECFFVCSEPCISLAYTQAGNRFAVLSQNNSIYVIEGNKNQKRISLPDKRQWADRIWDDLEWKDIAFSPKGSSLFVLDDHGTVEKLTLVFFANRWARWTEPDYPPLWGEAGTAEAILPMSDGQSLLLLDRVGGIHWRGEPAALPENFTTDNLMKYYNANDANKEDLTFWKNENELLLLSNTCRLDFITSRPVDMKDSRGVAGRYDLYLDPIPSLRAHLTFDRKTGVKRYPSNAVAVVSLPQADTIVQLVRNGTLLVHAMPNGVRMNFPDKAARVYIPKNQDE